MRGLQKPAFPALASLVLATSAFATDPPHRPPDLPNLCEDCHQTHNAPGMSLTTEAGNANLCMSCHSTHGLDWAASDQANPGTSGSSHRWDALVVNSAYGSSEPSNQELLSRLEGYTSQNPNKKIMCSTCHDQHTQADRPMDPRSPAYGGENTGWGRHFQRIDNETNQACRDCHSVRDMNNVGHGSWTGNDLSHPVGLAIPSATEYASPPLDLGDFGTATGGSATTLDDTSKSWTVDEFAGHFVSLTSGANAGLTREITSNTATQLTFGELPNAVANGDNYELGGLAQVAANFGTATDGSTTSLIDSSRSWGSLVGQYVRFTSGSNNNTTREITSNTATQIDFAALPSAIVAGDDYEIDIDGNLTNNMLLDGSGTPSYTSGNVQCMSCHAPHYADSKGSTYDGEPGGGDGYILRRTNSDQSCLGCHKVKMHNSVNLGTKYGTWGLDFTCRTCHQPHSTANIYLVKETIQTPNGGPRAVDFRNHTTGDEAYGLANSSNQGSGPCETCHMQTRNGDLVSAPGTADFTAGGTTVTGSGTTWLSQLDTNWTIKRPADGVTAWTRIVSVDSDTQLTLESGGYRGATGSGSSWEGSNPRWRSSGSGEGAAGGEHPTTDCVSCHLHSDGFAADESGGNLECSQCHTFGMLVTEANRTDTYHHVMETDNKLVSGITDYPTTAVPTTATGDLDKTCTQCHADHNIFRPDVNSQNNRGRAANMRSRITTGPAEGDPPVEEPPGDGAGTGHYWDQDRDAAFTAGGICLSCHESVQTKNTADQRSDGTTQTPAIVASDFTKSQHDYFVQGSITDDSSTFEVACVKCHNSDTATAYQNGTYTFALHTSNNRRLLAPMGISSPGDPLEENHCFRCHHDTGDTNPGGGPAKTTAGEDYYGVVTTMTAGSEGLYGQIGAATPTNTLYFINDAEENPSTEPLPNAYLINSGTYRGDTTYWRRFMSPFAGSQQENRQQTTAADSDYRRVAQFVSPALKTGFTWTSGSSFTIVIRNQESNNRVDANVRYALYKWNADDTQGTNFRTVAEHGTEISTSPTNQTIDFNSDADVTFAAGDKIVCEIEFGVTTSQDGTVDHWWGDATSNARLVMPSQVTFDYESLSAPQRHSVGATSGIHKPADEGLSSADGSLSGANRHVECTDCHNPHVASRPVDTGTATSTTSTTLTDSTKNGEWLDQQWVGHKVIVTGGTGAGQAQDVTDSDTLGTITVASWDPNAGQPSTDSTYRLEKLGSPDHSNATEGVWGTSVTMGTLYNVGAATFDDGSATVWSGATGGLITAASNNSTAECDQRNWSTDQWATYTFRVVAGTSSGSTRTVNGNNQTTLTLDSNITLDTDSIFVVYKSGTADTPTWDNGMVGGFIRNELDRNGRWYRITAFSQPTADPYYELTITPAYDSFDSGGAATLSNTKMTSNTSAPEKQWQMDYGTLYSISKTTITRTSSSTKQYEICLKCHSNYAYGDSPPDTPSGHQDGTGVAQTNVALDFHSDQLGFHPIYAIGQNQPTAVTNPNWDVNAPHTRIDNTGDSNDFGLSNTFTTGWFKESLVKCSDCHASDSASDPLGPHASGKKWILRKLDPDVCWVRRNDAGTAWETICNSDVPSTVSTEEKNFCLNCHRWDVYGYVDLSGNASGSASIVLSRVAHDVSAHSATYGAGDLPRSGIVCNHCHGGDRIGGIHGSNMRKYPLRYDPNTSTSSTFNNQPGSYSGKRLLNGATWFALSRATTSAAVACWTKDGADKVNLCGQGHTGSGGNTAEYTYDDAPE